MKIVRIQYENNISYGSLESNTVHLYSDSPFNSNPFQATNEVIPLSKAKLIAPCEPSKIICLGTNYRSHAVELKWKIPDVPLLFLKPPSAIIGPEDNIMLPPGSERIDYEGELAIVIGTKTRNATESTYAESILGYSCFNDVTDRIAQSTDGQWTRAKGYDTFAALGPCIDTDAVPHNLNLQTAVNGEIRQSGTTSDLIFGIPKLISFISSVMTLMPGDVIATGTPEGIGPLKAGDTVEVTIQNIGTLRNYVIPC
jgi:2-keto-4-pentenoate hydratase/2-oxohepta-3-ene-1,7-dioic acid hydratase in catechol pathway